MFVFSGLNSYDDDDAAAADDDVILSMWLGEKEREKIEYIKCVRLDVIP